MSPAGESEKHRRLKKEALQWAFARGFRCCASEVRAPRSAFIVDVAAIRISRGQRTTAIFECKQSREDLRKDNRRQSVLKARLEELDQRRLRLEHLLAVHYPTLRVCDSLFPEWATFDFSAIGHQGYQETLRKIQLIQRQLTGNVKFDRITNYQLGNLHYLVAPPGLVEPSQIPLGWGMLEVSEEAKIEEKTVPTWFNRSDATLWLERICAAATRRILKDS